jgi:HAD superfamily hydrolase (TIGR01509 family)
MRKPEREIYEYTLKRMGLRPEEVVFIDNFPMNLPTANRMGIHTILYRDPKQLRADLGRLGVRV